MGRSLIIPALRDASWVNIPGCGDQTQKSAKCMAAGLTNLYESHMAAGCLLYRHIVKGSQAEVLHLHRRWSEVDGPIDLRFRPDLKPGNKRFLLPPGRIEV